MKEQIKQHTGILKSEVLGQEQKHLSPNWLKKCVIEYDKNKVIVKLSLKGLMNNCYQIIPDGTRLNILAGLSTKDDQKLKFVSVSTSIELGTKVSSLKHIHDNGNGDLTIQLLQLDSVN